MNDNLVLIPTRADLIAGALAAVATVGTAGLPIAKALTSSKPAEAVLEQVLGTLVGKNVAPQVPQLDKLSGAFPGDMVLSADLATGAVRGAYTAAMKRGKANAIFMDSAKGVVCNIAGRYLDTYLSNMKF